MLETAGVKIFLPVTEPLPPVSCIYGLADPRADFSLPPEKYLRYVGQSSNLKVRFKIHKEMIVDTNPKALWLNYLHSLELMPAVLILEEALPSKLDASEKYQIRYWRDKGADLLNVKMMSDKSQNLSDKNLLYQLRKNKNVTLKEVQKATGIDAAILSRMERGETKGEAKTIEALSGYYELPAESFEEFAETSHADRVKREIQNLRKTRNTRKVSLESLTSRLKKLG